MSCLNLLRTGITYVGHHSRLLGRFLGLVNLQSGPAECSHPRQPVFIQHPPAALVAEGACAGSGGFFPATPRLVRGHESSRAGVSARGEGGACAGQGRARCACAASGGCASRAGRWRQLRWSGECERRPGAAGPGAVRPRPRPPACPPWVMRPAWRAARAKGRCRLEALVWVRAPEQGSRLQH